MNIEKKNGVTYLTFDLLKEAGVRHGFSTRLGGVSEGYFSSLNLGFGRGDLDENVRENFKRVTGALGIDYERLCFSKQTHTNNVIIVNEEDAGNGISKPRPYDNVDGLVTNVLDLPLVIFTADCIPLFLYDPVENVIGAAHSGWRGTAGKIGKVTVEKMCSEFGSRPENILCCIGPGICRDCYEVSSDVTEKFVDAFGRENADKIIRRSVYNPDDPSKYMLDLWMACRLNFLEAGITEEHIEVTDYCTKCHSELFYSHRIMGNKRGSMAGFISL